MAKREVKENEEIKEEVTNEVTEEVKEEVPAEEVKEEPKEDSEEAPKEEKVEAPEGFISKKKTLNKCEYDFHEGRKYKILKGGIYGIWADTGTSFQLSELNK